MSPHEVIDLMELNAELLKALKDLLALPVAIQQFGYLDQGIGTQTYHAAWLRAREAVSKAERR